MRSTSRILKLQQVSDQRMTINAVEPELLAYTDHQSTPDVNDSSDEKAAEVTLEDPAVLVEEAKEEARCILADADEQVRGVSERARSEGYQCGYEAGMAAAEEEMRQRVQSLAAVVADINVDKSGFIKECEEEIVSLVVDVARKVISKELATDRSIIVKLVDNAINKIVGQAVLRIRVSPDDYDLVREYWIEQNGTSNGQSPAEIVADKRVKAGGCVIDTQGGGIDAQVETQLAEIKRAFDVVTELM